MKLYSLLDELNICTTDKKRIVSIKEDKAKALFEKYTKDGYVIFSPSNFISEDDSMMQLKDLISEVTLKICEGGFCYTPVYASFVENGETIYEYALIIYPFDKFGNQQSFEELIVGAMRLAKQYNQDSLLVKTPVEVVNKEATFDSIIEEYFTTLHLKRAGSDDYIGAYINAQPSSRAGAHVRYLKGEKFISYLS